MRAEESLLAAENCVIPAPGVIKKRRGFSRATQQVGGPIWKLYSSPLLGTDFLAHAGTQTLGTFLTKGDGVAAWVAQTAVDAATVTANPDRRMQFSESGVRIYCTSLEGTRRLDATEATTRYAGMPLGLAPDTYNMAGAGGGAYDVLTGTGGFIPDGSNTAYRVTWHRKDGLGVELGGPPTARLVVRNQTGTSGYAGGVARNVALRVRLPVEFGTVSTALATTYFFRLWRSRVASTGIADDEMYLVYEAFITGTDVTNGYASVTDSTPDTFLLTSPRLHTNAVNFPQGEENTRQGIVNADEPPPWAETIASWQGCMWYGNTQSRALLQVNLLAIGGTGLVADDTITINGTTYTAKAAPATAVQFKIETTLASSTMNIEATVRNLCEVVNRNASDGVRLYPNSVGTALPGGFVVVAAGILGAGANSNAASSRGGAFRPNLTSTAVGDTSGSTNRLFFSKTNRPDAVPVINSFQIGSESEAILQLAPFRDRLIVFTDGGIYQVTGVDFSSFSVSRFDASFRLLVRESVVLCDDRLYAWCREGIVEIDDGGVRVVSLPIETRIERAVSTLSTDLLDVGFALADRSAHLVSFFFPNYSGGPKGCPSWWAWDTRSRVWTTGAFKILDTAGEYDHKSTGCLRGSDGNPTLANWHPTGADCYIYPQRTGSTGIYNDTDLEGKTKSVLMTVTSAWLTPVASAGRPHWQQVTVAFNSRFGSSSLENSPSTLTLAFATDRAADTASVTLAPTATEMLVRCEVPTATRRSNRIQITMTNDVAEYVALSSLSIDFGQPTRFSK